MRPRPPPPKAALIATGRPCSRAKSTISSGPLTGPSVPGASGAPTRLAISRARTLSPSASIAAGGGPIQVRPASGHGAGEGRVLGEEAVAGVHRVGAGPRRDGDDLLDVEVGLRRGRPVQRVRLVRGPDVLRVEILVGVDGDAGQARVTAGTCHADGDLAAVRDQDFPQFGSRLNRLRASLSTSLLLSASGSLSAQTRRSGPSAEPPRRRPGYGGRPPGDTEGGRSGCRPPGITAPERDQRSLLARLS